MSRKPPLTQRNAVGIDCALDGGGGEDGRRRGLQQQLRRRRRPDQRERGEKQQQAEKNSVSCRTSMIQEQRRKIVIN